MITIPFYQLDKDSKTIVSKSIAFSDVETQNIRPQRLRQELVRNGYPDRILVVSPDSDQDLGRALHSHVLKTLCDGMCMSVAEACEFGTFTNHIQPQNYIHVCKDSNMHFTESEYDLYFLSIFIDAMNHHKKEEDKVIVGNYSVFAELNPIYEGTRPKSAYALACHTLLRRNNLVTSICNDKEKLRTFVKTKAPYGKTAFLACGYRVDHPSYPETGVIANISSNNGKLVITLDFKRRIGIRILDGEWLIQNCKIYLPN